MNVVTIEGCGGPAKAFKYREEPFPVPGDNEVVIGVVATCVNELDIWRTQFEFKLPQHWNNLPGLECTGKIIGIGKDVHEWKIGDQVCALLNGGGFAQAVAVPATQVLPLPLDNKSLMRRAACLPEIACTTWEAVIRLGKLSANMTLLVYQRCGKICDLAIQLAEMVQASVIIATDESTLVKPHYSHVIVDRKSPHFKEDVLQATGNKVVDRMCWTPEYMAEVVSDMKENMWPAFSHGSLVLPEDAEEICLLCDAAKAHKGSILTLV